MRTVAVTYKIYFSGYGSDEDNDPADAVFSTVWDDGMQEFNWEGDQSDHIFYLEDRV